MSAFQADAFQNDAFQVLVTPDVIPLIVRSRFPTPRFVDGDDEEILVALLTM